AFDGMFKPAAYSARRRTDAADMSELLWQFRGAVAAVPTGDQARLLAVHEAYRKRYQDLYRQRGQYLVDYGLAQRENENKSAKPDPAPAVPTSGTGTPAATGTGTGLPAVTTGPAPAPPPPSTPPPPGPQP